MLSKAKSAAIMLMLSFFMVGTMTACSDEQRDRIKEDSVEAISSAGSSFVASALDCSAKSVIKKDMAEELGKLSIFKTKKELKVLSAAQRQGGEEKVLGTICSVAARPVLKILVGEGLDKIPDRWECSGDSIEQSLQAAAASLCAGL